MLCKSILLFLFSFILIENAWSLSVSPAELYFEGNINENLCQEITISGNEKIILYDKWDDKNVFSRDINSYLNYPEKFSLSLDYEKFLNIENESKLDICLSGKKSGKYYGILFIQSKENPIGIGIWIRVLLKESSLNGEKTSISGRTIENPIVNIKKNNIIIIFLMIILILILILILFILKYKNKGKLK